jgi:hypothetical protein
MLSDTYELIWLLLMLFSINGFTVILILFFKNPIFKTTQLLLAINLLGVTLASVIICLVESRLILKVPFLFRLPSPIYYLMFPSAYLYLKLIVKDRSRLKKGEYLNFLPAVIHFMEMLPFYLKSKAEKIVHINAILSNDIYIYAHNEGWLPNYFHNIIRGLMAIVYAIAMWRLLQKTKKIRSISDLNYFKPTLKWLTIFTWLNGVLGVIINLWFCLLFLLIFDL